jgi:hypothetical protein
MLLEAVVIIVCILLVALILNRIEDRKNRYMSFMESMNLTNLPIITLNHNGSKFNFLLDTGSNISHINSILKSSLTCTPCNYTMEISGMEGNSVTTNFCNVEFSYKDRIYEDDFALTNLESAFNRIKEESGVTVHGILGTNFLQKYKYVLDFDSLIAYIK